MGREVLNFSSMHLEYSAVLSEENLNELVQLVYSYLLKSKNSILYLKGELGAGKTTFVRQFLKCIFPEYKEGIRSPSFTLLNVYSVNNKRIAHYDFYRLPDNLHTAKLAVEDLHQYEFVFVEWISKAHEHEIDIDFDFCLDIQNSVSEPNKRQYNFFKKPRKFLIAE